jgi:protease YdgD
MTRRGFALALLVIGIAAAGPSASEKITQRLIGSDEATRWRGVGSFHVSGKPSCTAVLISDIEAITAAHCVVDRTTGQRVDPAFFTLVLGQRADGFAAVRKVTAVAFSPGFLSTVPITDLGGLSTDLALLALDYPVTPDEAAPLQVTDWSDPIGAFVDIVGYERDGSRSATIREGCMGIQDGQGVAVVTCDVITGISGSPVVLRDRPEDPPRLVAAVSSGAEGAAIVVAIAPRLAELRGLIARQRTGG